MSGVEKTNNPMTKDAAARIQANEVSLLPYARHINSVLPEHKEKY